MKIASNGVLRCGCVELIRSRYSVINVFHDFDCFIIVCLPSELEVKLQFRLLFGVSIVCILLRRVSIKFSKVLNTKIISF